MNQPFQKKVKEITGDYTLTLADLSFAIRINSATPSTTTLPTASGFPNFHVDLINVGSGAVTCNGLTLLQGNGLQLYCNGSSWTNLKIIGNVSLGDIPVMASAEFATKISDETGTGLVVFNTSPNLITPTFGDVGGGNYSTFEADGTLVFNGDATVFNDFSPNPILRSRIGVANNPTLSPFVGNIEQYTFAVNDYVYDNFEYTHEYKEGTDTDFHIHWATNGEEAVDKYVKWEVEYAIANRNGATPNTFATTTVLNYEFLIPANTPDKTHYSMKIGTISGTNIKIGAIMIYRLRRIASTGDAPVANPFGLQCGLHHERDSLGSRQEVIK